MTAERMSRDDVERLYDELYEQYGKPLEVKHRGEYVAISPRGETILGASLLEVAQAAKAKFGTGNFVYRVGARAVGRWRRAIFDGHSPTDQVYLPRITSVLSR